MLIIIVKKHFKKSIGYNKVEPNWKEFPLNKVDLAHKKLESGETVGKIILLP